MTLHFFHRYDRLSASFRARCECYSPYLEEAQIPFRFHSLLDSTYLVSKYSRGKTSFFKILSAYFKRIRTLLSIPGTDVVLVYIELFPYFPGFFETYLRCRGVRIIYDISDPYFHLYDRHKLKIVRVLFGDKIRKIIRNSTAVIAGNQYLSAYAAQENKSAFIIPSVVDLTRYRVVKKFPATRGSFVIGWIGTPVTAPNLQMVQHALGTFCRGRDTRIILVGSGKTDLGDLSIETRPWSEENEVTDILDFDVGIMPLPDTPFARGKGGMKIMQYMACGVPAIASPVGFNCEIIQNEQNGFLASSEKEWVRYLTLLYEQRDLCSKLGGEGRRTIEKYYCLQVTAPRFISVVKDVLRH